MRKNIARKSDIGIAAAAAMAKGNLVSDDLMTLLIKSELDQVHCEVSGFTPSYLHLIMTKQSRFLNIHIHKQCIELAAGWLSAYN